MVSSLHMGRDCTLELKSYPDANEGIVIWKFDGETLQPRSSIVSDPHRIQLDTVIDSPIRPFHAFSVPLIPVTGHSCDGF